MLALWFNLPLGWLMPVTAAIYGAVAALIWWITFRSPLRTAIQSLTGVVAPFFGAVALLFGLLLGFLASDISDRNRAATRALMSEADALRAVQTLSVAAATDMSGIRDALRAYTQSMLKDEWPTMVEDGRSATTEAAFGELLRRVSDPAIGRDAGQAVAAALLAGVARIGSARSDRLALAEDHTNELKWLTVLILGIITQVAIALVHIERSRAQAAALTVFTVALVAALSLVAEQEQPFAGAVQVSPAPIASVLALIAPKPVAASPSP